MKQETKLFAKKLLTLVMPIAFQQFMLALVNASDAIMLGVIDQDSLAAVSLASQIPFVENLFLAAMTTGLSILAAQYWGRGDLGAVERIFAFVMKVTATIALVFGLAALLAPRLLMMMFTSEEELIAAGAVYLRTVSPSLLLTGISQVYLCILKNSGSALRSTVISSVSVVVNIVINAVLIYGLLGAPRLGIAGAAVATVIARVIEVAWCIIASARRSKVHLRLKNMLHDDKKLRADFLKYSLPVLGNQLAWGLGFTMYSVIMGHLGKDAVAANSIANIVKNLIVCFCTGLASGGGIIVGNELGRGRLDTAKEFGRRLCKLAIWCGLGSGALLIALIPLILKLSELEPAATSYLGVMLLMCSYYVAGKSVNMTTIGGIFCAGGDSRFGLICDTVTLWCVTVPLGFFTAFVLKWPVLAVYFVICLDEVIKLPAVYHHYKKYKWVRNLTVSGEQ